MGLFSKKKKTNSDKPEDTRRQEAIDNLKKFDPAVRPGGEPTKDVDSSSPTQEAIVH